MKRKNQKQRLYEKLILTVKNRTTEDEAWLNLVPVGREFGSKDYAKLAELDAKSNKRILPTE
ncbi:MAG: hypothetical protein K2Y13_06755 [Burkholderiaceae bacterium]|nr:hypothetical protein [Burkholderiaceae bacterium]